MTEEVMIAMHTVQYDTDDTVELICKGKYTKKEDAEFVIFDQVEEDQVVKNLIKFSDGYLKVHKKGAIQSDMEFMLHRTNASFYVTPFGTMDISTRTNSITTKRTEDKIEIEVIYDLTINQQFLSKCMVLITITAC